MKRPKSTFGLLAIIVIILMTAGTVIAAFVWISNQIITPVTVTDTPIVLSGDFDWQRQKRPAKGWFISLLVTERGRLQPH